ncbi:MAG: hypothetical protein JWM44_957 [Bacilli bacterium]|nr:hypothetical protein [Bacilli bacterium]
MMKVLYRYIQLVFVLSLLSMLFVHQSSVNATKSPNTMIILSVRSSPTAMLENKLDLNSTKMAQILKKAKSEKAPIPLSLTDIYVTIVQAGREKHFRMEQSGNLWNETELERLVLAKKTVVQLQTYAENLRRNHYGKMIPWEEAQHIVPRKSIFSVTDVETGLTFRVQRRAGSTHADVQPLTKKDTQIMKEIYNNHWSWERKAILVQTGNERLAASMNGMPHGGDGIPDNGFSGHFCIHFYGSTTHRSNYPDVFHQLMVHKAAGKLQAYLDGAPPYALAEIFIEAMNRRDSDFLRQVSEGMSQQTLNFFVKEMDKLTSIRIKKPKRISNENGHDNNLSVEIKLLIALQQKDQQKKNAIYHFVFTRESKQFPWRVKDILTDKGDIRSKGKKGG